MYSRDKDKETQQGDIVMKITELEKQILINIAENLYAL